MCEICENRPSIAPCGCCEKEVYTCGACCLLRHTEGRYQVQKPDESSETFERIAKLQEETIASTGRGEIPPDTGLVLVSVFDGIGGARRALELVDIKPAVYISIENDPRCQEVVKRAWPEVISLGSLEDVDPHELGDRLKKRIAAARTCLCRCALPRILSPERVAKRVWRSAQRRNSAIR